MKPHKHAAVIRQWADGAEVQWRMNEQGGWRDLPDNNPSFHPNYEYRVKPKTEIKSVYLKAVYYPGSDHLDLCRDAYTANLCLDFDQDGFLVGAQCRAKL